LTSATSSGRTQCTPLSTNGEPKRLVRGGVERHLGRGKRLESAPQPFKLGLPDAGAGAAGIDQPSVRIVVGEQQRAEPRSPPLRVGPADHDEFLALEAFDLEPQAAVAGRVCRIGAFRDDALELEFAGLLVEGRALAAVVIAVVQRRRDVRQQGSEPRLGGRR
jgi:hypothetical protein